MQASIRDQMLTACARRLLGFLARYSVDHPGATPSYSLMAREANMDEETVGHCLTRLENKGAIHVISWKPIRVMVNVDAASAVIPRKTEDTGRYERFLNVEARRQGLGRFIGEFEMREGRGPTLREMMKHLGTDDGSWTFRAAEILAQRGLIQFGQGVPTRLTEVGRTFYGIKPTTPKEKKMTVVVPMNGNGTEGKKTRVRRKPTRAPQMSVEDRIELIGRFIGEYVETHHVPPDAITVGSYFDISPALARTVFHAMVEQGLVEPSPTSRLYLPRLTPAGKERFSPPPVVPEPEPQPEPQIEEPVVEPEVRSPEPQMIVRTMQVPVSDLSKVDLLDLINELVDRGYKVIRR